MAKSKKASLDDLSYEAAYAELEKTVSELEGELGNLDRALELFERGQELAKYCAQILEQAELKVQELSDDGQLEDLD